MSFTFLVSQSSPVLLTSYFPLFPPGFLGKRFRLKSKEQVRLIDKRTLLEHKSLSGNGHSQRSDFSPHTQDIHVRRAVYVLCGDSQTQYSLTNRNWTPLHATRTGKQQRKK